MQISTFDNKGGAAKIAWTLKQELEKRNHKTSMFVAHKLSTSNNVYQIPNRFTNRLLSIALASDLDFFQSDDILKTEEYKKADIVHCHNLHGYYFNFTTLQKMAKEKPVVWTLHDMWAITPHCAHAFDGPLKKGFYQCPSRNIYPSILWPNEKYLQWRKKHVYESIKFNVVVPSHWLKRKIKASILGNQHISLIYNGIDSAIFKKYPQREIRKKLSLPLDKKIITFIAQGGKGNPWKGWEYIENIISHCRWNKKILFLCIGGNKKFNDENIKHIPYVFDELLLAQYYSISDLFLLTSLAENFPVVVLEAMACGVPVVSFDVGGVKEAVLHKENGYIAKYKDTKDLVRGINYISGLNKEELEIMSLNSIKRVKKYFTLETMIDNYLNLYRSLIKS